MDVSARRGDETELEEYKLSVRKDLTEADVSGGHDETKHFSQHSRAQPAHFTPFMPHWRELQHLLYYVEDTIEISIRHKMSRTNCIDEGVDSVLGFGLGGRQRK